MKKKEYIVSNPVALSRIQHRGKGNTALLWRNLRTKTLSNPTDPEAALCTVLQKHTLCLNWPES